MPLPKFWCNAVPGHQLGIHDLCTRACLFEENCATLAVRCIRAADREDRQIGDSNMEFPDCKSLWTCPMLPEGKRASCCNSVPVVGFSTFLKSFADAFPGDWQTQRSHTLHTMWALKSSYRCNRCRSTQQNLHDATPACKYFPGVFQMLPAVATHGRAR